MFGNINCVFNFVPEMERIEVVVSPNKLTAKEAHPLGSFNEYVRKPTHKNYDAFLEKKKEWFAIERTLRMFVIREFYYQGIRHKYTIEQYGDWLWSGKRYFVRTIGKNSILI